MFEIFPIDGGVNAPQGFYADGVSAGLKGKDKSGKDLLDIAFYIAKSHCNPL